MGAKLRSSVWILVALGLVGISALSVVTALNSEPRSISANVYGDTYISTYDPLAAHGSEGKLMVTRANNQANWTLILFNLVGMLRPGDLVVDGRVRLATESASPTGWPATLVTGRLLTNWDENKVTFKTKPLITYDIRTATFVDKRPDYNKPIWIDVTKQLSRWHTYGGPSNFGTVISFASDADGVSLAFGSKESTNGLKTPELQVKYKPGNQSIYGYGVLPEMIEAATIRVE